MYKRIALGLGLGLLLPSVAAAKFQFQPSSVTVGAGPATLDGVGTTFFVSGRVDLGTFLDDLVWDAGLQWWKKTKATTFTGFDLQGQPVTSEIDTSYRDLAVLTGVKYLFHLENERIVPFARGGLSLNFVDVSLASSGGPFSGSVSGGGTDLGIYLGGGAGYHYNPSVLLGLEVALNITDADHFLFGLTASFPLGRK